MISSLQLDQRALLNERVVKGLLHKLEEAVTHYEHSVAGIFTAVGEDLEKKQIFADKLSSQMKKVNPLLDELYSIQKNFKAASASTITVTNKSSKLLVTIQLKIRLAQKSIENCLHLVQEAEKQEATRLSLPKIQANLEQLNQVEALAQKDLDAICQQVVEGELKETDVTTLQEEVTALIDSCSQTVSMLKAKLKEAAAELKNPYMKSIPRIQVNPPSSLNAEFQAQLAREITSLKVGRESKTSTKNVSNFGFSKIAIP